MPPRATYRLQFHKEFTFADARGVVPYLAELGVSHLYASPIFTARPGSTHGYDVIDYNQLNPELGTRADFDALIAALHENGMGFIIDFVPNHMGATIVNDWWADVLRQGQTSAYARFFDIFWDAPQPVLKGRILLPVLGDTLEAVIGRGELKPVKDSRSGEWWFHYFDNRFPIAPETAAMAGNAGDDPDAISALAAAQHYVLAHWQRAAAEINYRRFFDINELVCMRMEDPAVFEATHGLLKELIAAGQIDGVRLDHIDGMRLPAAYFAQLQTLHPQGKLYVLVEKILGPDEPLRRDWAVSGTTGYEFIADVGGLFVDQGAEDALTQSYKSFTGNTTSFETMVTAAKRIVMRETLRSELNRLTRTFTRLAHKHENTKTLDAGAIEDALVELVAHFPVYRTYVANEGAAAEDRTILEGAKAKALAMTDPLALDFIIATITSDINAGISHAEALSAALDFQQFTGPVMAKSVEDTSFYRYGRFAALNEVGGEPDQFGTTSAEFHQANAERLATFPDCMLATATHDHKRGEDTRARLYAVSEYPSDWGAAVARWKDLNGAHKQSIEGTLAPSLEAEYLFYQVLIGAWPLDWTTPEYKNLETFVERLDAYMLKAVREAKQETSWLAPNAAYESALSSFIHAVLDPAQNPDFIADALGFADRIASLGAINGLAQTLLKLTSPGMPDIYQGTEFWDQSLVDPDNRRPVDYALRQSSLAADLPVEALLRHWRDGRVKQRLVSDVLRLRKSLPDLFSKGSYLPLQVEGEHARHVLAFARTHERDTLVVVVPRLIRPLLGETENLQLAGWGDTAVVMPEASLSQSLTNVLNGEPVTTADSRVAVETVLDTYPLGLLLARS